ncbi:MAG: ATP-binding protein [Candidatus Micrarchaeota archaeon]
MEENELLKILYADNPWWVDRKIQTPETKRRDFFVLKKALDKRMISAIIGPRRVGKSVLMEQLIQDLLDQGVPPKNILYMQFDDPKFDKDQEDLINSVMDAYSKNIIGMNFHDLNEKVYIFFDEIQKIKKWSDTIKASYYDRNFKIKFTVSGSSSTELTKGSSESLVGRIMLHYVMPLKFIDYLRFKSKEDSEWLNSISLSIRDGLVASLENKDPSNFWQELKAASIKLTPAQNEIEILLSEYLVKGGYIELLSNEDYPDCSKYLREMLQLVIYRDIVKVFDVRNPKALEDVLLYLATHSSERLSKQNLSQTMKIKIDTLSEYLNYLKDVFFITSSRIYATNRARQLRNPEKTYIMDTGIRNALNGTYSKSALTNSTDVGLMAETVVHDHLRRLSFFLGSLNAECFYWKNGTEIDNVLVYSRAPLPVEVKYQNKINDDDEKSIKSFLKENKSHFGIIITKNKLEYKNNVFLIPLWLFLLLC